MATVHPNQSVETHSIQGSDRRESLKAASVGAIAVGLGFGLTLILHAGLAPWILDDRWLDLPPSLIHWQGILRGAIAGFSGALFGITYRYAVRQDRNSHLKSGTVLAFGLVRGLAEVEMGLRLGSSIGVLGLVLLERLLWFAIAAIALDWSITQQWIKPLLTNSDD